MESDRINKVRLGDVLIEYGYITEQQLQTALAQQKQFKGKLLGSILIDLGYITEKQMLEALARRLGIRMVEISSISVDVEAVRRIPRQMAEKYCMMAVSQQPGILSVVVNDPMNFYGLEDIRQVTGMSVDILLAEKEPLEKAIQYHYAEVGARQAAYQANASIIPELEEIRIEDGDDETPIIKLLDSLVQRAYQTSASDIHIEPFEHKTTVRMRVDGTIVEFVTLQKNLHAPLIARIKILSDLDIAERRVPQDGHFRTNISGITLNIRVSLIPTVFGEKAVLRLLAGTSVIQHAENYGMRNEDYQLVSQMLRSPNGIIYMTGPTGSGKSTTLYMILEDLSQRMVNISTIEDPVEKNLPKLNQMQINNTAGITFESGLRALLRQDPDIIMVGETRDSETASIAVRAAITGHMVLSTLHTNDAASTVVRLVDMGLEPYMIANSLMGVVAQRLMRRLCPYCAEEKTATEEEAEFIGFHGTIKIPKGCPYCNNTGYKGRVAIHEILNVDKQVRKMISAGATTEEIKNYGVQEQGMRTLKAYGSQLVKEGVTSIEELIRVAYYD